MAQKEGESIAQAQIEDSSLSSSKGKSLSNVYQPTHICSRIHIVFVEMHQFQKQMEMNCSGTSIIIGFVNSQYQTLKKGIWGS